jgi:hypothetical protein
MTKRTGFLQLEEIPLNKVGLSIRAYGKKKNYDFHSSKELP